MLILCTVIDCIFSRESMQDFRSEANQVVQPHLSHKPGKIKKSARLSLCLSICLPLQPTMPRTITLASRASQLAQIQTNIVLATLQDSFPTNDDSNPTFTTSFMATAGDKNQSQALYLLGGKALWTKELEVALKEKHVDMLVHSLKDVPTTLPDGCVLGAILEREDPVDSLVVKQGKPWKILDDLPAGSVVGTSSVRRVAQLKRKYPDLKFLDVVSPSPIALQGCSSSYIGTCLLARKSVSTAR